MSTQVATAAHTAGAALRETFRFSSTEAVDRALEVLPADLRVAFKDTILPGFFEKLGLHQTATVNIAEIRRTRQGGGPGIDVKTLVQESFQLSIRFGKALGPLMCVNIEPTEMDRTIAGGRFNTAAFRSKIDSVCKALCSERPQEFLLPSDKEVIRQAYGALPRGNGSAHPSSAPSGDGASVSLPAARKDLPAPTLTDPDARNIRCPFEKGWNPEIKLTLRFAMLAFAHSSYPGGKEINSNNLRSEFGTFIGMTKVEPSTYSALKSLIDEGLMKLVRKEPREGGGKDRLIVSVTDYGARKVTTEFLAQGEDGLESLSIPIRRIGQAQAKDPFEGLDLPPSVIEALRLRGEVEALKAEIEADAKALEEKEKRLETLRKKVNSSLSNLQV